MANPKLQKTISIKTEIYELIREYKYDVRVDSLGDAIEHAIKKARENENR